MVALPMQEALEGLAEEGFLIHQISVAVKTAFAPLVKELEDTKELTQMERDMKEVERIVKKSKKKDPSLNAFSVEEDKSVYIIIVYKGV